MSRDLVDRLKHHIGTAHENETEAAAEIERLRAKTQIGWYNPASKRFCYTDEKEAMPRQRKGYPVFERYTVPVFIEDVRP